MPLPLEGVRVLDFTHVYAGPTCTRILADLGANIVKIEGLTRIDGVRMLLPTDSQVGAHPWNRSIYFSVRNPGKRSLTVEMNAEARDLILRFLPDFDIVAESFTPRVMKGFGLDYESLCKVNPRIVMISLSGYGHSGPQSEWTAYGMGLEPASGISQATGYAGGPPVRTGISFTDPLTGMMGAGAVLAALHYRRRTGRGQYIDLSEQEAAMAPVAASLLDFQMNGRQPQRIGNRSPWAAPRGCYRCAGEDSWVVISVENDTQWSAFTDGVGHPEWRDDPRFATVLDRQANQDQLDALIEAWTGTLDHYEAMRVLQEAGVATAAVLNGREMLLDPQFRARGQFDVLEHAETGKRPYPRNLVAKFSAFETAPRRPPPLLGEHNREVLLDAGLSDAEIGDLEQRRVIGTVPRLGLPPPDPSVRPLTMQDLLDVGAIQAFEPDYREQLGLT